MQPRRRRLRILCLHGFRQSGSSFRGRTAALARRLAPVADLVFVDAPHSLPVLAKHATAPPATAAAAEGLLQCNGGLDAGTEPHACGHDSRQQGAEVPDGADTLRRSAGKGSMQQQPGRLRRAWLLEPCQVEVSQVTQQLSTVAKVTTLRRAGCC